MPPTVYAKRAIEASNDLIAFYKSKIDELELFKEDLEAGNVEASEGDFSKYSVNRLPVDKKHTEYWRKHPNRHFDQTKHENFSIRCDNHHNEPFGICDVAVLNFADIIEKIGWEDSDPSVIYGETESDSDGYPTKHKFRSDSDSDESSH